MSAPQITTKKVLDVMRSGEWLRTQWIARAAAGIEMAPWDPALGSAIHRRLKRLERCGLVERRSATEQREGLLDRTVPVSFPIARSEWRLTGRVD